MMQLVQRPPLLAMAALLLALVFTAVLWPMGFSKYASVLAGGYNFHDFPGVAERLILSGAYAGLMGLYGLWLWQTEVWPPRFRDLFKRAGPFLVLAFLAYPYSSDGYLYLHYGAMALHGVNPYLHPATDFLSPLSPLLHWSQPATYGPVAMVLFTVAAGFMSISPILALVVLKGFCALAHVLNAYWLGRSLAQPRHRSKFTALYLFNPVLLNEFVVNAHVDVFLTTTIILLMRSLHHHRYVGAMLALWAGCLTKTLPILWLPLVVAYLIRQRQWRSLGVSGLLILLTIGLLSRTVLPDLAAWKSLVNPGVGGLTARSLYHGLNLLLDHGVGLSLGDRQTLISHLTSVAGGGFCGFYLWLGLRPRAHHTDTAARLVADLGWVTVVLLLLVTPWLMAWYPTGLVAIALLSRGAPYLRLTSLVFCMTPGLVLGTGSGDAINSLVTVGVTVGPAIGLLGVRLTTLAKPLENWIGAKVG